MKIPDLDSYMDYEPSSKTTYFLTKEILIFLSIFTGVAHRDEEASPFRLSTTTRDQFSWKGKDSNCTESTSGSSAEPTSLSTESNMSTSTNSYSSLKSRIKAVHEKYRKSSVTKQIKNKFSSSLKTKKIDESMSTSAKFRSHSHGALPSLDEFAKVPEEDLEDDINGIWSASQLAAKEKNTQHSTPKAQVHYFFVPNFSKFQGKI